MIGDFYGSYASFIMSSLLGIFTGAIYDIFRILRIARTPHLAPQGKFYNAIKIPKRSLARIQVLKNALRISSNILVLLEDIIFWIITLLSHILFIYHVNDGEIRLYFFVFSLFGAMIYFFTAGKIVMYFSIRIIFLIRCLLYWSFYIIIYPIRQTLSVFIKFMRFINNKAIQPAITKIKSQNELKYSEKRIARILADSKSGFLIYRSTPNGKKEKKYTT